MHEMTLTMRMHYLLPSEAIIPGEETLITTLLGSCVSVCIHDPVRETGGINHFMLPTWNGLVEKSHKYGDYSINFLIDRMIACGSEKENLIAKVFGGSAKVGSLSHVGEQNIALAKALLREHEIKITAMNVGGVNARKIIFNTQTGVVQMKYITYNSSIN